EVEVNGIVDSITSNLTEQCENNKLSPLNEAVRQIFLEGELDAKIVAISSDLSPPWLLDMLQSRITFPLDFSQYFDVSGNSISLDDFRMGVMSNSTKIGMGLMFTMVDDFKVDFMCECSNSTIRVHNSDETVLSG